MTILGPEELDPRVRDERNIETMEEGEEITFDTSRPERRMRIGRGLSSEGREGLISVLWKNHDIFARAHSDMTGIDPNII